MLARFATASFVNPFPAGFAASIVWCWDEWAWGYCREFEELGTTALILGPLQVQFEWSILG